MLSEPDRQTRRILYIVDAHVVGPDSVSSAVRAAGGVVERCTDVYEGLSRLGRGGWTRFDAVVLCLDYLAVEEYEFIRLAKQCASEVPVLVQGGAGSMGDVGRAMAMGADRWVDGSAEALRSALVGVVREAIDEIGSIANRQAETGASCAPRSAGSVGEAEEPISDRGDWLGTEAEPEPRDRVVSDDDAPVRVPWSRWSDVPVRRPPGKNSTSASSPDESADSVKGIDETIGDQSDRLGTDAEPLLSEGELSALAGVYGNGESDTDTDGGGS